MPRWLTPVLAFFLVLGHACELPALAELVAHPTEATHHSDGDHGDGSLISCHAVGVPTSQSHLRVGPGPHVAEVLSVGRPAPVRPIVSSPDGSKRLLSRLPLFLLHASLLI
jgi:hypothetical protein